MSIEQERLNLQEQLDVARAQQERNEKGQFATPPILAASIVEEVLRRIGKSNIQVLEPSCGTGAFLFPLLKKDPVHIVAVEKDEELCRIAQKLWESPQCQIECDDFLIWAQNAESVYDALIANPPYIRHHHLSPEQKRQYGDIAYSLSNHRLSSLAGLHAYFLLAGTSLLKEGGVCAWLVPSELFAVNYGREIRKYLSQDVSLERLHFFDATTKQFDDALVSSCVVIARKKPPRANSLAQVTFGDFGHPSRTLTIPLADLRAADKWQHLTQAPSTPPSSSRVGDLFKVKRGVVTGNNNFFMRSREMWEELGVGAEWLVPCLPPPRRMHDQLVTNESVAEFPHILSIPKSCGTADLPVGIQKLLEYVDPAVLNGFIVRHRSPWYAIGKMQAAPIVCTYMSRSEARPFRFIRNRSEAVITNVYLGLYPRYAQDEDRLDQICDALNTLCPEEFIRQSREYGGGLKKLVQHV